MAGPFSGTVAIRAMKDGDYQATIFPGTTAGLQAAIDSFSGGKGEVRIGPGTLSVTTVISIHGGCCLRGSGKGATVIKRATGSLTWSDANYSGNLLLVTAYGSNGTPPSSSGAAQTDINIFDLTLDGNYTAFQQGVDPGGVRHMGIFAVYANRMLAKNVEVKNFIQDGIWQDACANTLVTDCHIHDVGQCTVPSTLNGISIFNNQDAAAPYGQNCRVSDCIIDTVNGTSVALSHVQYCSYKNSVARNCGDMIVEFLSVAGRTQGFGNIVVSGIQGTNAGTGLFSAVPAANGINISEIEFSNNTLHKTTDSAGGIGLYTSGTGTIKYVKILGNRFYCDSVGASGSKAGVHMDGNVSHASVLHNTFVNMSGPMVELVPAASGANVSDVTIGWNTLDGGTNFGIALFFSNSAAATIERVTIANNVFIDTNQVVNSAAIGLSQTTNDANQKIQDIIIADNSAYRTSGSTMQYGVRFAQTGAGILDRVFMSGNVFKNLVTQHYVVTGGSVPTNVSLAIPPGRGTDISAAATIGIPSDGTTFHVTGNTNITNGITVNPWDKGRTVTLIFEGTPTVSDTGTSKLAGNFVAAGTTNDFDTLTLTCDGSSWYEVTRSIN